MFWMRYKIGLIIEIRNAPVGDENAEKNLHSDNFYHIEIRNAPVGDENTSISHQSKPIRN